MGLIVVDRVSCATLKISRGWKIGLQGRSGVVYRAMSMIVYPENLYSGSGSGIGMCQFVCVHTMAGIAILPSARRDRR